MGRVDSITAIDSRARCDQNGTSDSCGWRGGRCSFQSCHRPVVPTRLRRCSGRSIHLGDNRLGSSAVSGGALGLSSPQPILGEFNGVYTSQDPFPSQSASDGAPSVYSEPSKRILLACFECRRPSTSTEQSDFDWRWDETSGGAGLA